jgi:hypothetical protein
MIRHVRGCHSLTNRSSHRHRRRIHRFSSNRMGLQRSFLSISHGNFSSRPSSSRLEDVLKTVVAFCDQRQDVFCAIRCPTHQLLMLHFAERSATMGGNKTLISHFHCLLESRGKGDHKGFLTPNQHLTGLGRSPLRNNIASQGFRRGGACPRPSRSTGSPTFLASKQSAPSRVSRRGRA